MVKSMLLRNVTLAQLNQVAQSENLAFIVENAFDREDALAAEFELYTDGTNVKVFEEGVALEEVLDAFGETEQTELKFAQSATLSELTALAGGTWTLLDKVFFKEAREELQSCAK